MQAQPWDNDPVVSGPQGQGAPLVQIVPPTRQPSPQTQTQAEIDAANLRRLTLENEQRARDAAAGTAAQAAEAERRAASFFMRAFGANRSYEGTGVGPRSYVGETIHDYAPSLLNQLPSSIGNSPERQVADSAQDEFIAATLRQDSGAAIPEEELERQRRIYFPMPGDGPEVLAQKRSARRRALEGLVNAAGRSMRPEDRTQFEQWLTQFEGEEGQQPPARNGRAPAGTDLVFNDEPIPPQPADPWTPQQEQLYDAWMAAHPRATAAQLRTFAHQNGLGDIGNADEIIRARGAGAGYVRGSGARQPTERGTPPERQTDYRVGITPIPGGPTLSVGTQDIDAGVRGAADVLSAGFADEIGAVGDTVFNGGTYQENLYRQRGIDQFDAEHNPVARTVGQVAGALVIPSGVAADARTAAVQTLRAGGTREAALAAARRASAVRLGMEGGAYGAAHGAGSGDSGIVDRAAQLAVEGVFGAAAGGTLPYGAQAGRALWRGLRGSPDLARRIVYRAIRADGNDAAALSRQADRAEETGVPYMLADSGENARGAMSAAARQPGEGRTAAVNALDERQNQLGTRLTAAIERDLGPVSNPHEIADALMTQAQTNAAPLYDAAYAAEGAPEFIGRVRPILQRPSMRGALQRARRIAAEEGRNPDEIGLALDENGDLLFARAAPGTALAGEMAPVVEAQPTWQTLDYIKRGLDDVVEAYRDSTTGRLNLDTEGRAVNNTLRSFLRQFDEANPDYAAARAAWGGPVSGIEAMNRGRRLIGMNADDIEAQMRGMTPFETEMARLGARRAMAEQVDSRGDTANIVTHLAGTGKKRAMLARLFGDRRQFDRFVSTLEAEQEGFQTFRRARLGSPTAANVADDSSLAVAIGVGDLATSGIPIISALRLAARALSGRQATRAQQRVASLLGETDMARVRRLIAQFRQEERRLRSQTTGRPGRATGRVTTLVGTPSTAPAVGSDEQ